MITLKKLLPTDESVNKAAEYSGVSRDAIIAWMNGSSPSLAERRDFARYLQMDSRDLLKEGRFPSSRLYCENTDSFFGHFGLRYPSGKMRWLPITNGTQKSLEDACIHFRDGWTIIKTLNNRLLVFRPCDFKEVFFLSEAAEFPVDDDWHVEDPTQHDLYSPDFYRALQEYLEHLPEFDENSSADLQALVIDFVEERCSNDDEIEALRASLESCTITFRDEKTTSHWLKRESYHAMLDEVLNEEFFTFVAYQEAENYDVIIPANQILMIDIPRTAIETSEDD